jgi:hypothetical protein
VRLEAVPPVDLVVDTVWSYESGDTTPVGPPQRFVAGELVPGGDRPIDRIRAAITVIEIDRAAGVVVRREIDARFAFLPPRAGELWGAGAALRRALTLKRAAVRREARPEASCLSAHTEVPVLDPKNDALLQAIRNAGLRFAVLDAAH